MAQSTKEFRRRGVDVVIRVHTLARQIEFDRALFSLVTQSFQPVHPIVVTQGFDTPGTNSITLLTNKYEWHSAGHLSPSIINVDNPTGEDLRSTLLNVGIANGSLRYIAFLDSDDYLYEDAYGYLVQQAQNTGAAVTFGGITRRDIKVFEHFVFNVNTKYDQFLGNGLEDLWVGNFCPIHSFIVDRNQVSDEDLVFDTALKRLEDYELLLRICTKYHVYFDSRAKSIGVYNWHLGGGGSIEFQQDARLPWHQENKRLWNEARRRIWRQKCTIRDQVRSHQESDRV
jgi:Glycosyl transferase family 2